MDPIRTSGATRLGRDSWRRGTIAPCAVLTLALALACAASCSLSLSDAPSIASHERAGAAGAATTLWIYRGDALRGNGTVAVSLDGAKLGRLRDGDCLEHVLTSGEHELWLVLKTLGWLPTGWNRISLSAKKGEPIYLHVWLALEEAPGADKGPPADFAAPGRAQRRAHLNVYATRWTLSDARSAMADCHRTGAAAEQPL